MTTVDHQLNINGEERTVSAGTGETLLEVLREGLGLRGTKRGCNQGVCGACTVMIDGRAMRSCLLLAVGCVGQEIMTVEGLPTELTATGGGRRRCSAMWVLHTGDAYFVASTVQ